MTHVIIGTAGHVDHGKTSLIRALTDIETDRLAEEKRRGLSIELGFAYFDLPDGARAGIVDVPGHERFVDTMVAGAYGMDLVLFVVSAREGVQPQTVEHLRILDLLGVRHGILVATMRDLVDDESLELAVEEARELLQGTSLEGIPSVAVSSTSGEGIDDLKRLLADVARSVASEPTLPEEIPRLPVDRVFALDGFGLIVTGTLRGGSLRVGESLVVLPEGKPARVRTIQVHGETVSVAERGQRTALNLVGIEREALRRGQVLTLPGLSHLAHDVIVELSVAPDYPRIVEYWAQARLHVGTQEVFCRIVLLMEDELLPGDRVAAQLRTDRPIVVTRGERFVLRDESIQRTLGGGLVLDPSAVRFRRHATTTRDALEILRQGDDVAVLTHVLHRSERPFVEKSELIPYFPRPLDALEEWLGLLESDGRLNRMGRSVVLTERLGELEHAVASALEKHHETEPLSPGVGIAELRGRVPVPIDEASFDWVLERMDASGVVSRQGRVIRLQHHEVAFVEQDAAIRDAVQDQFLRSGLATPSSSDLRSSLPDYPVHRTLSVVQTLVQIGTFVRIARDYWVHRECHEDALERMRGHFAEHGSLSVAEFRDLTGASRKYAVPFLEHCDQRGWTFRDGNARRARSSFLDDA